MHNSAINEGATLPTILHITGHVIKKQRQFLVIGGLLLWVLTMGFQRGLEQTVGPDTAAQFQSNGQSIPAEFFQSGEWTTMIPHLPVLGLLGIVMIIVYLLIHISVTLKVFQTVEGKELSLQQTVELARRKLRSYMWTSIVQGVLLFLLFLLLIIPGVIFAVYRYFALYVVLYYGKTSMDALRESKVIVQNRRWKTLGYMLVIGILAALIILAINGVVSALIALLGNHEMLLPVTQMISNIAQLFVLVLVGVFFLRWDKTRVISPTLQS